MEKSAQTHVYAYTQRAISTFLTTWSNLVLPIIERYYVSPYGM